MEKEAGAAFGLEHLSLTHAGIDHQPDGQRKVRFLREITDDLRAAVFGEGEVVFRQVADNLILPGARGGEDVDDFDAGCESCFILSLGTRERGGAEQ